jgi:transcriptional regulator
VSPSWYPDKDSASRVPTWNYATAHLRGELHAFHGESELGALVGALTRQHEAHVDSHWAYDHNREDLRRQLSGITGFRMVVTDVQLTFKLNQNHPLANRIAVAEHLQQQGSTSSHDVAELMRARMPAYPGED